MSISFPFTFIKFSQGETISTEYNESIEYPELGGINREVGLTLP